MGWFQRHLTFANVVSSLALFSALGGTSYAAIAHTGDAGAPPASTAPPTSTGPTQPLPAATPPEAQTVPPGDPPQTTPPGTAEAAPPQDVGQQPSVGSTATDLPTPPPEPPSASAAPTGSTGKAHSGNDRSGKKGGHEGRSGEAGPPPWAAAHGWRCKQAGNAPGSEAFKRCIASRKR